MIGINRTVRCLAFRKGWGGDSSHPFPNNAYRRKSHEAAIVMVNDSDGCAGGIATTAHAGDLIVWVKLINRADKKANTMRPSLRNALESYALSEIEEIEITDGEFLGSDWEWIKQNQQKLTRLRKFTITDDVYSVAFLPGVTFNEHPALEKVYIAKVQRAGSHILSKLLSR